MVCAGLRLRTWPGRGQTLDKCRKGELTGRRSRERRCGEAGANLGGAFPRADPEHGGLVPPPPRAERQSQEQQRAALCWSSAGKPG